MDAFYYWKDIAQDVKADRIGWFRSAKDKLDALKARHPNYLWVFRTPHGCKGNVQLLARLVWSDAPVSAGAKLRPAGESNIFYDPGAAGSVWYLDSGTAFSVTETTEWTRQHLNVAIRSNFQGPNGQHPLDRPQNIELEKIAKKLQTVPFMQGLAAQYKPQPPR